MVVVVVVEDRGGGISSSQKCDPLCSKINNWKICLASPAPTPSGHCYWNQRDNIEGNPFPAYCATYSSSDPGPSCNYIN